MARTLQQIQQSMLVKKAESLELSALDVLTVEEQTDEVTSSSKVAVWRLWIYILAFGIWVFETLQDTFKRDIEALIAAKRIHNFQWYRNKALDFRYGQDLIEDSDKYIDDGLSIEQINSSKIVSQAAVVRVIQNGRGILHVKVAKNIGNDLGPLTTEELEAFDNYMFKVGDAGTLILPKSRTADDLKMALDVYYNPLVLNEQGIRLDGTANTPVVDAIRDFLFQLEFNGELILTKLTDHLQQVEGVEFPVIQSAQSKFGILPFTEIDETYIADAGYMRISDDNLTINYIAREQ